MAIGDVYQLVIRLARIGEDNPMVNTLSYRQEQAIILDTPEEDLVQAWRFYGEPDYKDLFSAAIQIVGYQVVPKPGNAATFETSIIPVVGAQAGEVMPYQVSPLISWRTGQAGRSKRGRTYMPPVSEAANIGGQMSTGFNTSLITFANSIITIGDGLATSTWQLVVWSETLGSSVPVNGAVVPFAFATQRSRRT